MRIGPKYKIARRLGVPVFEKTQTQKFAISQSRKAKKGDDRPRPKTDFGIQILEKQKARYTYGVGEKQFSRYVGQALQKKGVNPGQEFFHKLETRLDNVVYRLGVALTRQAARQMVSHGHITVNGKRVTIPSFSVSVGDMIAIREGSKKKALFRDLEQRLKGYKGPAWLSPFTLQGGGKVTGVPTVEGALMFNIEVVLDFYRR